jgi:hypothetical protein
MTILAASGESFHSLFEWQVQPDGAAQKLVVRKQMTARRSVPCPETGRLLTVASVEVSQSSVCPACTQLGAGGYVSFVGDLRLAFACPSCCKLIWIAGA